MTGSTQVYDLNSIQFYSTHMNITEKVEKVS